MTSSPFHLSLSTILICGNGYSGSRNIYRRLKRVRCGRFSFPDRQRCRDRPANAGINAGPFGRRRVIRTAAAAPAGLPDQFYGCNPPLARQLFTAHFLKPRLPQRRSAPFDADRAKILSSFVFRFCRCSSGDNVLFSFAIALILSCQMLISRSFHHRRRYFRRIEARFFSIERRNSLFVFLYILERMAVCAANLSFNPDKSTCLPSFCGHAAFFARSAFAAGHGRGRR